MAVIVDRDQEFWFYDWGLDPSLLGETKGLTASSSEGAGKNFNHCLEMQHVVELNAWWREGAEEATRTSTSHHWLSEWICEIPKITLE